MHILNKKINVYMPCNEMEILMCSRARLDEYIFRSILIFVVGIFHAFPYVFGIDAVMVIFSLCLV